MSDPTFVAIEVGPVAVLTRLGSESSSPLLKEAPLDIGTAQKAFYIEAGSVSFASNGRATSRAPLPGLTEVVGEVAEIRVHCDDHPPDRKGDGQLSETEKITINLGPVDLGRIDLLVEQGIYSNRTDLIRTAIRNQLDRHEPVIQDVTTRQSYSIGVIVYGRGDLESLRAKGKKLSVHIVGMLTLTNSVTPELALATIESISIRGKLIAPKAVREALGDRINTGK
jgi:Arc/MetJ-type ribon-helix-helix transcriptional regulator